MIGGKITDKMYHGCAAHYAKKLIDFEKGERCICATSYPFWREPDSFYPIQERESTENRQLIKGPIEYVWKFTIIDYLNKIKQ